MAVGCRSLPMAKECALGCDDNVRMPGKWLVVLHVPRQNRKAPLCVQFCFSCHDFYSNRASAASSWRTGERLKQGPQQPTRSLFSIKQVGPATKHHCLSPAPAIYCWRQQHAPRCYPTCYPMSFHLNLLPGDPLVSRRLTRRSENRLLLSGCQVAPPPLQAVCTPSE